MTTILTILHVLVCLFLMLTVLLQAGKGGGMGAAFGGGSSSGTVFGGSGAGNFLKKLTVGAAAVFMATSMTLAYLASTSGSDALKAYSAQQRRNAELMKQRHEAATGTEGATAPTPVTPGETGDTTEGAVDEAAEPVDTGETPAGELVPSTGAGAALEEKPPASLPEAKEEASDPAEPAAPTEAAEGVVVPTP